MDPLLSSAVVVVVGGDGSCCEVAHHLARPGWKDVLLREQGELAGGTSWHAAGMVGRLRSSTALTRPLS